MSFSEIVSANLHDFDNDDHQYYDGKYLIEIHCGPNLPEQALKIVYLTPNPGDDPITKVDSEAKILHERAPELYIWSKDNEFDKICNKYQIRPYPHASTSFLFPYTNEEPYTILFDIVVLIRPNTIITVTAEDHHTATRDTQNRARIFLHLNSRKPCNIPDELMTQILEQVYSTSGSRAISYHLSHCLVSRRFRMLAEESFFDYGYFQGHVRAVQHALIVYSQKKAPNHQYHIYTFDETWATGEESLYGYVIAIFGRQARTLWITSYELPQLSGIIPTLVHLKHLRIRYTSTGSLSSILEMVSKCKTLQSLEITFLMPPGAFKASKLPLRQIPSLKFQGVSDDCVPIVRFLIAHARPTNLDLSANGDVLFEEIIAKILDAPLKGDMRIKDSLHSLGLAEHCEWAGFGSPLYRWSREPSSHRDLLTGIKNITLTPNLVHLLRWHMSPTSEGKVKFVGEIHQYYVEDFRAQVDDLDSMGVAFEVDHTDVTFYPTSWD